MKSNIANEKEFLTIACRWADSNSTNTARKWWDAFCEVIIREMFVNGIVYIPNIGKIETEYLEATQQTQVNERGETVVYKVPARFRPVFTPSDEFINDINGTGVTKAYRKRKKQNALTKRDLIREMRVKTMEKPVPKPKPKEKLEEQEVGKDIDIEQVKADFKEMLRKKRKASYNTKINLKDEEDDND